MRQPMLLRPMGMMKTKTTLWDRRISMVSIGANASSDVLRGTHAKAFNVNWLNATPFARIE